MPDKEVIVVGGGLAGLMTAITVCENGGSVVLVSHVASRRSHSVCAQGGINGAVNTKGEGDSPEFHFDDTVYGGDFLANQPMVRDMCYDAPKMIYLLDRMGVTFNRTAEGLLDFRRFGEPADDFHPPVMVLHYRRAAFHPVPAIDVADAEIVVDRGVMDVAADDALGVMLPGIGGQRALVFADIGHRVLHLQLRPLRERPISEPEHAADVVEDAVDEDRRVVGLVAEQREPARLRHDQVEDVAVHHQVAPPVGAFVNCVLDDFDAAEMRAVIAAQEFVVVSRDVDYTRAFARLPQERLRYHRLDVFRHSIRARSGSLGERLALPTGTPLETSRDQRQLSQVLRQSQPGQRSDPHNAGKLQRGTQYDHAVRGVSFLCGTPSH